MEKPNLIQKSDKYRHSNLWNMLLLLALLAFGTKCVSIALTTPFSFDGSVNAQVARSLAENGSYTTTYDQPIVFDPIITTGLPLILPVAFSFKLFGSTFSVGLMVNALYAWLFAAAATWYLLRSLRLHASWALLALALIAITPQFAVWSFGLYGEMPMLFYLIFTAIFLQRFEMKRTRGALFWAGFCLGLAGLTKMIALFALPAAAAALAYMRFWSRERSAGEPNRFKAYLLDLFVFALGLLLPFMVYEMNQILVLGVDAYLLTLSRRTSFVLSNPSLLENQNSLTNLTQNIFSHFRRLATYIGMKTRIAALLMLAGLIVLGLHWKVFISSVNSVSGNYRNRSTVNASVLFLGILTLTLFGWWLLLTGHPWERYLFPAFVLLDLLLVSELGLLRKGSCASPGIWPGFSADLLYLFLTLILGLLAAVWGVQSLRQGTYKISFQDTEEKYGYLSAPAFIQGLPEGARVFGYGWWQAPTLSFAANTQFYDFYAHPELLAPGKLKDTYLVSDRYAARLDPESLQSVLSNFEYELVYQDKLNELSIYQLTDHP